MAITRIHAIKATVHKSISYICDPAKTDDSILISSFACSPQTARYDFAFELSKTRQSDKNQAFHLIQSFAPGEVSYEEAHRIGTELADRLLGGHHAYIIATHTNVDHAHNHIIFCAADHITHRKYHDCKETYKRIRMLNDEICKDHQLSVIPGSQSRGKSYKEWQSGKDGTSWKSKIRADIDATIRMSKSYETFLALMRSKGYEIDGEGFGEGAHKYITFKSPGMQRAARGSAKSLGVEYTKERIRERIEQVNAKRVTLSQRKTPVSLIDTSQERFQNAPGLKKWAELQNLKLASKTYAENEGLASLSDEIERSRHKAIETRARITEIDHRLHDLSEIIRYAGQYAENRKYHLRHKKSKNPEQYYQDHEANILLYDGARSVLQRHGVSLKSLNAEKLRQEFDMLTAERSRLYKTYTSTNMKTKELSLKHSILRNYIGIDNTADKQLADQEKKQSL